MHLGKAGWLGAQGFRHRIHLLTVLPYKLADSPVAAKASLGALCAGTGCMPDWLRESRATGVSGSVGKVAASACCVAEPLEEGRREYLHLVLLGSLPSKRQEMRSNALR
ncbi:hypothetical protein caldi_09480 [Caldinitratiruptor microaerophilus]|uniref:Uncharacterized protein n=1 Tax=Caldinitratiruptor microaerophilus TaxID=671077 RepID=A0AA35CK41_9FIRM|nr:hypothetical protein caldi_09480 [Caldinitratiruptor microaerophilus]